MEDLKEALLLEEQLETMSSKEEGYKELQKQKKELEKKIKENLSAYDRVTLARNTKRPSSKQYIENLFTDFIELHGDRGYRDDPSIIGGMARFMEQPVMVIGHQKGKTLEENIACNFGMPCPEGYRKAMRLMNLAQKFNLPIITFVDTPGAFPGLEAENRGQGEAIAQCLATLSSLTVPVISIVIGEGGSGGALALAVSNHLIMLEHAVFSVLSPEGFASILWKDSSKSKEASELMKLTSYDLKEYGIVDEIIEEPILGVRTSNNEVFLKLSSAIATQLGKMKNKPKLQEHRYKKMRSIGFVFNRE